MSEKENFFNLDALDQGISRQLAEGMTTRVFPGQQAMISIVRTRIQAGEEIAVSAGDFWRTPGNVEHGFSAGPEGALIFDVFAPPREEYSRAGEGFS